MWVLVGVLKWVDIFCNLVIMEPEDLVVTMLTPDEFKKAVEDMPDPMGIWSYDCSKGPFQSDQFIFVQPIVTEDIDYEIVEQKKLPDAVK